LIMHAWRGADFTHGWIVQILLRITPASPPLLNISRVFTSELWQMRVVGILRGA